jgi:hypothetical protein
MTPIQPFNTAQLVLRYRIVPKFLPPITQALPPTTWLQRLLWRLADRAGLLVHNYVPSCSKARRRRLSRTQSSPS